MAGRPKASGARRPRAAPPGRPVPQEGAPPAVVLLLGDDPVALDREIAALRRRALGDEGSAETNASSFHLGDRPVGEILDAAREAPFLAPHRFVVLRHLEGRSRVRLDKDDLASIEAYCKAPAETAVVVFQAAALARNRRPYTTLAAKAHVVESHLPEKTHEWAGFLLRECTSRGIELDAPLRSLVFDRIGPDAARIRNELDKLVLYLAGRREVGPADLSAVLPELAARDRAYALGDALGARDLPATLSALRLALRAGDPPVLLAGQLAGVLRQLAVVKWAQETGGGRRAAAAAMGLQNAWFWDRLDAVARRTERGTIESAIRALARADAGMKSGAPGDSALEIALLDLLGPAAPAPPS